MITWEPCQNSACVQTGTDEHGNVYIRSTATLGISTFSRAEWDEFTDGVRKQERERIRQLAVTEGYINGVFKINGRRYYYVPAELLESTPPHA